MPKLTKSQNTVLNLVADEQGLSPKSQNPISKEIAKEQEQEQSIFEIMEDIKRLADEIINY